MACIYIENIPDKVAAACKMPSCNCGALEQHNVHSGVVDSGPELQG